jgi:hypothetical protein
MYRHIPGKHSLAFEMISKGQKTIFTQPQLGAWFPMPARSDFTLHPLLSSCRLHCYSDNCQCKFVVPSLRGSYSWACVCHGLVFSSHHFLGEFNLPTSWVLTLVTLKLFSESEDQSERHTVPCTPLCNLLGLYKPQAHTSS